MPSRQRVGVQTVTITQRGNNQRRVIVSWSLALVGSRAAVKAALIEPSTQATPAIRDAILECCDDVKPYHKGILVKGCGHKCDGGGSYESNIGSLTVEGVDILIDEAAIWEAAEKLQGQIAAEIRVMLGEGPYDEKIFDQAQRDRRIEAMQKRAAESTSDAERHESWMKMHLDAGWVYGDTFDPAKKTHPNLLPWGQLPATTRSKARIFDLVAKAALELTKTL